MATLPLFDPRITASAWMSSLSCPATELLSPRRVLLSHFVKTGQNKHTSDTCVSLLDWSDHFQQRAILTVVMESLLCGHNLRSTQVIFLGTADFSLNPMFMCVELLLLPLRGRVVDNPSWALTRPLVTLGSSQ